MSTGSLDVVALRAHSTCTHINSRSTAWWKSNQSKLKSRNIQTT